MIVIVWISPNCIAVIQMIYLMVSKNNKRIIAFCSISKSERSGNKKICFLQDTYNNTIYCGIKTLVCMLLIIFLVLLNSDSTQEFK